MWPFIFRVHLEFSSLSCQTSESFLLKLRPATHLDNALLHSSKASSKVGMLKSNIQGSHKNPSKSATSRSPPFSTKLPNSAFHYWYPDLYSQFHPLLPQLQPQCYLCCSLFQYPPDHSWYPHCALTLPHQQFQREGTETPPYCLNCPEKLCQNWELHTPEPNPTSSQLWPGHPCCYPSTCCSTQDARWENWCLSASEELKICLLPLTQTHRCQHTECGSRKLWSGVISLPSLPTVLHHLGPLACTITSFAKDKGKSYILCQDEKVPSLTNYTFYRNSNKVFWAQYWLSLPPVIYKNASYNSVDE